MKLSEIPMLYHRAPFDPYHAKIMDAIYTNQVTRSQAADLFVIPGVGFNRALWMLTLHLVEHKRHGQQTFVIPEAMQDALERTSLAGVEVKDLKMPYPAIYLATPGNERSIWGGEHTQWHKTRGLFMWHEKGLRELRRPGEDAKYLNVEDDRGLIHVYLWGIENEHSRQRGDDASLWVALDLNEMSDNDEDLEAYLNRVLRDRSRETKDVDVTELAKSLGFNFMPGDGHGYNRQADAVISTLRIAFNALLYMDSSNAETERDPDNLANRAKRAALMVEAERKKSKSKKQRCLNKARKIPEDTVTWLGRSFGRGEHREPGTGTRNGSAQRVHWVRGHWWPRRDTIKRRITELKERHGPIMDEYGTLLRALSSADTPEVASTYLIRLSSLKGAAVGAESEIVELTDSLETKRRWVKPYKKGSLGSAPKSHTYVLGGKPTENGGEMLKRGVLGDDRRTNP